MRQPDIFGANETLTKLLSQDFLVKSAITTMRITGGNARGRSIASPQGPGVRPTGAKVRQAVFNILGARTNGARFLDICAGTGLIGLEALSRGAKSLIAVEENRQMVKAIQASLKKLGYEAEVIAGDLRQVLPVLEGQQFDIIFADPPYGSPLTNSILTSVDKYSLLAEAGVFIIEHARNQALPDETERLLKSDVRHYGQTSLTFFVRR
ncbi:MAG TPA: 16S rRNA (guanine(966)-N(2))-methyltransferase RsmD [Candidatus Obscuribacterales bacterium]